MQAIQTRIITLNDLESTGDGQRSLLELADKLRDEYIKLPYYQRPFVWEQDGGVAKVSEWFQSINSKNGIGSIVTYQLPEGGHKWLLDGRQRLTATNKLIDSPSAYGIGLSSDEIREICGMYMITVQHRIYTTHQDAMKAFQHVNLGTTLDLKELYKGEICHNDIGKLVYKKVPEVVFQYENQFATRAKLRRAGRNKFTRDALVLFWQYLSEYRGQSFPAVTGKINFSKPSIEKTLSRELSKLSILEVENHIRKFEEIVAEMCHVLREMLFRVNSEQRHKAVSRTLFRWILHFRIYIRNNKYPIVQCHQIIENFLKTQERYSSYSVSLEIPQGNGKANKRTLGLKSLSPLSAMCKWWDVDLIQKRKRKIQVQKGAQESHSLPFSRVGNNKTITEPSSLNLSRGPQPIDQNRRSQ